MAAQIIEPRPKPPRMPVTNRRLLFDAIPPHLWSDQSTPIAATKMSEVAVAGRDEAMKRIKAAMCPIEAPKQRAQNGIGLPRYVKHRSGMPWQPRCILLANAPLMGAL